MFNHGILLGTSFALSMAALLTENALFGLAALVCAIIIGEIRK